MHRWRGKAAILPGTAGLAVLLLLIASPGLADLPPGCTLVPASDFLGRDISGNGQSVKTLSAAARPLLVQVLDAGGAPVAGAEVVLMIEPAYSERGEPYYNGGLVAFGPPDPENPRATKLRRGRDAAEPTSTLVAHTDPQGFAGAYYFAGRTVDVVAITAHLAEAPDERVHLTARIIDPRWGFLLWSGLLGGLALFLFGMRMTSRGLEQAAGSRLRVILGRVSDNRLLGLVTGILVTALVQSSSATTVMVVSFTNAGLMQLGQTLAIILGADVGTTLTVQLIAFSLKEYSLLIVFVGFALSSLPQRRYRNYGKCVLGFGLIFFGMSLMGNAMDPLRDRPLFRQILLASAERPLLVLLVATLFTGLIQSSAATIGIALTFAFQGLIDLSTAVPVIFGANIGTCVTAGLAAIGTRREAQRVAFSHVAFKLAAVLVFLPFLGLFETLVRATSQDLPRQIANAHTIFNVFAALVFLPLLGPAERLVRRLLPDTGRVEKGAAPKYLDERILETPTLALAQVTREISRMGDTVLVMLREAKDVIATRDEDKLARVVILDDKVDMLDTALRRYLTRLSRVEMAESQAAKVASLLYMVHHLETIGDLISKNLMELARKLMAEDLHFSAAGTRQWTEFYDRNIELLEKALAAFATNDKVMAAEVVRAKEDMSRMARALHFHHLSRLGEGIRETEETSEIHIHLISDLRRILSNTVSISAAVVNEFRIPDMPPGFHFGGGEI